MVSITLLRRFIFMQLARFYTFTTFEHGQSSILINIKAPSVNDIEQNTYYPRPNDTIEHLAKPFYDRPRIGSYT